MGKKKHQKKRRKIHKKKHSLLKRAFLILLILGMLLCGAVGAFVIVQIVNAPDISEIDATPSGYLTTILDKDEKVMKNLFVAESNRVYVSLDVIPDHLEKAFIAIEDARFDTHMGIDIKGIFRAFYQGIKTGSFSQGASTITQQLLKNNVLTGWVGENTFYERLCRKIQEQYLAVRLEQKFSKDWILENYLNTINLGGGTRGVQVAAQYYFGKDVSQLTLSESALIAGITQNPSGYNPLRNPEKSLERYERVLNAMLEQGYISQEEHTSAMAEDILGKLNTNSENRGMQIFSWFEDVLLEQVVSDLMTTYHYDEAYAWNLIYTGGLTIYSTQDTKLQEICEDVATNSNWYSADQEISVVMMDVSSGSVAAIIGGSKEKTVSLAYNRATEAIRQPGSTIKMIGEYAAAIDLGLINLGTVINDEPYAYTNGTNIRNSYKTYKGMTTIREAVAVSSNVIALKAFQMVGMDGVFGYLQKFGITTLTNEDKNEALSIGGTYNGVTNLEMTAAYNTIANDGIYTKPFYYTKVVDQNGKVLLENTPSRSQAISPNAAKLLTCAMEEVIASGTGTDAAVKGIDLAGKSGTTNDSRDIWFVGFSSYYTCGIWGGHDNNAAQNGSRYVKLIWQEIMKQAHAEKTNVPLVDEEVLTKVTICTKCGKRAIPGTCDSTLQGNMTAEEYFVKGTAPVLSCTCHIKKTLCSHSGRQKGIFCPNDAAVEKIYLKAGTEGTADAAYVMPEIADTACDVHTSFWDQWFDGDSEQNPDDGTTDSETSDTGDGNTGGWLDGLWGNLFG